MKNVQIYLDSLPGMTFEGQITDDILMQIMNDWAERWIHLAKYFSDGSDLNCRTADIRAIVVVNKAEMKFGEQKYG